MKHKEIDKLIQAKLDKRNGILVKLSPEQIYLLKKGIEHQLPVSHLTDIWNEAGFPHRSPNSIKYYLKLIREGYFDKK